MAVKIRLARHGAKKHPVYRVVAANIQSPRDGRFLEILGTYDPNTKPSSIKLKQDRIQHWLDQGALPTKTVSELIVKAAKAEAAAEAAEG